MKYKYLFSLIIGSAITSVFALLISCTGNVSEKLNAGDTLTTNSTILKLIDHGDFISVTISDPKDPNTILSRYALVHKDSNNVDIPEGISIIKTPVSSVAVFSSIYSSALEELGVGKIITAVADADYFTSPFIKQGLASGTIADIGNSMSPSLESLVDISPQAILSSYNPTTNNNAITKSGIAVIPMADYMEPTPLGRAEWILLEGALTGKLEKANEIYEKVCSEYCSLQIKAQTATSRPLVITDMEYSGRWTQAAGGSYAAKMIADAGGRVLFADNPSTGSIDCDYARVYDLGIDADVWLIRSFGPLDRNKIIATNKLNAKFKAMNNGSVYYTNTSRSTYYDDIAFHPELILADYVNILHPELSDNEYKLRYYSRIN